MQNALGLRVLLFWGLRLCILWEIVQYRGRQLLVFRVRWKQLQHRGAWSSRSRWGHYWSQHYFGYEVRHDPCTPLHGFGIGLFLSKRVFLWPWEKRFDCLDLIISICHFSTSPLPVSPMYFKFCFSPQWSRSKNDWAHRPGYQVGPGYFFSGASFENAVQKLRGVHAWSSLNGIAAFFGSCTVDFHFYHKDKPALPLWAIIPCSKKTL